MAPLLSDLPEEMIDSIGLYLDCQDICNLRMTCNSLYQKSYHAFGRAFFESITVMIIRHSLQELIDISKNERLRGCVRCVNVSDAAFIPCFRRDANGPEIVETSKNSTLDAMDQDLARKKMARKIGRQTFGRYMSEQNTLRKQGKDVDMLSEALRNFPNLMEIRNSPDNVHPARIRGAPKIRRETGLEWIPDSYESTDTRFGAGSVQSPKDFKLSYTHVTATILSAIAASDTKLKETLCLNHAVLDIIIPQTKDSRRRSTIPARTFSEEHFNALVPCLEQLHRLEIKITPRWDWRGFFSGVRQADNISRLICLCPNVREFRFHGGDMDEHEFLCTRVLMQCQVFTKLRRLDLCNPFARLPDLLRVLGHCSNDLEELELTGNISDKDSLPIVNACQRFPKLTSVALYHKKQKFNSWSPSTIPRKLFAFDGRTFGTALGGY